MVVIVCLVPSNAVITVVTVARQSVTGVAARSQLSGPALRLSTARPRIRESAGTSPEVDSGRVRSVVTVSAAVICTVANAVCRPYMVALSTYRPGRTPVNR